MSLKDALTNSLLMFVAATCVVLIVKALPQTPPPQAVASGGAGSPSNDRASNLAAQDGVKVFYLHGNTRCPTCRTIEAYAQEAVQAGFADELESGKITWQVVNYESPGNEHFATDYEVVAPNVVLAMFKDGKQVKWKGLPEVWEHVGDKAAYFAFVQASLREFLGEPQVAPSTASSAVAPPTLLPPTTADTGTNPAAASAEPAESSLPLPE